ncbi:MAG: response regulator transcription factor [Planctomycetes bacterium]|nr:response regulator transcription factor [Planctomycetota bacterium]
MEKDNPVVFVVDDDEAICESLRLLIADIGLEVRTFTSARQFLEEYDPSHPGCLVLDVRMSGISGLELQARLNEMGVHIPTIIITGHADVPMAVEAMKAGATDFIEKPFRDQVLLDSIQKAVDLDLRVRRQRQEHQDIQSRIQLLTQREREVMDRLVAGKSNKNIAFDLGISQKTVDFHRANILDKIGVSSVVELVRLTQKAGGGQL